MKWWQRIPKKLAATVIGVVVQVLPIPGGIKDEITKLAIAYIVGQGLADVGKEKAKVEAGQPSPN